MSCRLYFGIRIPDRSYSLTHLDVDTAKTATILELKDEISQKIEFPKEEIELMLHGSILEDNDIITNVHPDSLVHVLKKTTKYQPYQSKNNYSKEDCKRIAELFGTVANVGITVGVRIVILANIIVEYPEFRRNLGAQALIRDSVLFHSLDKPEVIEKIAENYSIICDAEEYIVKIIKKELAKNANPPSLCDESLSDTTSSSEEENSNANQSEQARIRRISRDQLTAALMAVGTASSNSLSNIAQRNSNLAEQREQEPEVSDQGTSTTTATAPQPVANRISSSLLNNALAQALMFGIGQPSSSTASTTSSGPTPNDIQGERMDTTESQESATNTATDSTLPNANHRQQFTSQLQIMHEMGLIDDEVNISVLLITNGNVENAINLVLTSYDMGNSNSRPN